MESSERRYLDCVGRAVVFSLLMLSWMLSLLQVQALGATVGQLTELPGGKAWVSPSGTERIKFLGDVNQGYDVTFEVRQAGAWVPAGAFPQGKVWAVYNNWDVTAARWYGGEYVFKVTRISGPETCVLTCVSRGEVAGQPWDFEDRYSFEHGAFKLVRRWHHASPQSQSPISLVTAVRVPVGDDPRTLFPGILYNGNPGTYPTAPVPRLHHVPNAKGVYEEHRYPVPFVNLESTVSGRRMYGSLLSVPSKVPQGHKGDDQWWSLGLEWRWDGTVDLLSISGAVATNSMNSRVYGSLNGMDPYDDVYIDVQGDVTFEKTLYLDLGISPRVGYAFRETIWKAFEVLNPTHTPHLSFREAMDLKLQYATGAYVETADGAIGFPFWHPEEPNRPPQEFTYGWVGRNLGIAYGLLNAAEWTGNEAYRRIGMNTIRFFVENVRRDVPGLLYGDYFFKDKKWIPGRFGNVGWPDSVAARQFGEILDTLADLVRWGRSRKLPEADRWLALLKESGDFLVKTKRHQGMFPRSWYPDGRPVGWQEGKTPPNDNVTTAGAYLIAPLAKLHQLTGDKRYLEAAESALRGYYEAYGRDLRISYHGATLDAAAEDKEAGAGMLHAALAVYEATRNKENLNWARDAADWLLTWYCMFDAQLPPGTPLHGFVNTTGWTAISVQNEELDCWGAFMAPDFHILGTVLNEKRYKDVGRMLFEAHTQAIARPGAMFGLRHIGMELEHFNHTNCTYARNGAWRGPFWSAGIAWVLAATLQSGARMAELGALSY